MILDEEMNVILDTGFTLQSLLDEDEGVIEWTLSEAQWQQVFAADGTQRTWFAYGRDAVAGTGDYWGYAMQFTISGSW